MPKHFNKTIICLLISFLLAGLLLGLNRVPIYQIVNQKLFDLQMNLRPQPKQDSRIIFINMDDEAIEYFGRWPWPRNIFANLTDTLSSLGARQILFDVTFNQPTNIIVKRESVDHIFQGKEQINDYILNESGAFKAMDTIPKEDALWTLDQIRQGYNQYTNIAQQKLNNAVIDNDLVLLESLKRSNSFIGYSFEVLNEKKDIARNTAFPHLKKNLINWIKSNPNKTYKELSPSLKSHPLFNANEIQEFFVGAQINTILEYDLEETPETIALALLQPLETIGPLYNLTKKQIIKEIVLKHLNSQPQASWIDISNDNDIFDKPTQEVFKSVWLESKKEYEATKKFSLKWPLEQNFLVTRKIEPPFYKFTQAVKGGGFLNGIPDLDGVLRSVPLFVGHKDNIFPHIAISSAKDILKPKDIVFVPGKYCVLKNASIGDIKKDIKIPINKDGRMLVNWTGRFKETFKHFSGKTIYSLYSLEQDLLNLPPESEEHAKTNKKILAKKQKLKNVIQNNICIIGLTAVGTHDYNPTPFETTYPMVGTHGNLINSILTEQFLEHAPRITDLSILIFIALVLGLYLPRLPSLRGLLFTGLVIAGLFITSLFLFSKGFVIDLASPSLLSLFAYLGITSYKFSTEEKAKRDIKNAFGKYVSPEVIEHIMQDPSKLQLGGEKRIISVHFSDIRGFTTYCEKRSPEEIVSILNEYLDEMTKIIVGHNGTLDKYVGDEIMAIWGAPEYEPPEINAKRAVIASWKMLVRLKEMQTEWKERGLEPLDIGIGVNTGEVIVGNMGSELRMDYTVIGDTVNLGARVEALTRDFNTHFIISEFTFQYVKDIIEYKPLKPIKVKGKDIPVMVYDIVGLKPNCEDAIND